MDGPGFESREEESLFCNTPRPAVIHCIQGVLSSGINLATKKFGTVHRLAPRLRMIGTIPVLPIHACGDLSLLLQNLKYKQPCWGPSAPAGTVMVLNQHCTCLVKAAAATTP